MNMIEVELLLFVLLIMGAGAYIKGKKDDITILKNFGKRSFIAVIVLMIVTLFIWLGFKMITYIEGVSKSKLKMFFDRITNPLSGIRPAGIFGFLLMIAVYYIYKNIQIGNF